MKIILQSPNTRDVSIFKGYQFQEIDFGGFMS